MKNNRLKPQANIPYSLLPTSEVQQYDRYAAK